MYADDVVFMAETEEVLKVLINKFNNVCKRRGLKINVDKSEVMIVDGGNENRSEVDLNGKMLEVVKEFGYLRSIMNDKGTDESDCNKKSSEREEDSWNDQILGE